MSLRYTADGIALMSYDAMVEAGGGAFVEEERGFKPIERFAAEISVRSYLEDQNPFVSIQF
jgi:hypothetical protein